MLTGEFYNTIDDKGRILIPARLRSALEGDALYVTRGLETCLWLMLPSQFEELKHMIVDGPGAMFDRKMRTLQRGMIAPAQLCEIDKVGRINIPPKLRESVGLVVRQESVLLGTGNYLELWNKDDYEAYMDLSNADFLDSAQSLSDMIRGERLMEYVHYPVMRAEILEYLKPPLDREAYMVDSTCGEGGHTHLFLSTYPNLHVTGLDRDTTIQAKAIERMQEFGDRFTPRNIWFDEFFEEYYGPPLDLVLFDLGISSFHYEESERGFSFKRGELLDMRLDEDAPISALDVVNGYPEERLANVIYQFGEERYSRRIAKAIVEKRKTGKITQSDELASIIYKAVPSGYRYGRIHPATRSFQAIRIEVNRELDRIEPAIKGALDALRSGGRLAVISFHSLEDRRVKWFFKGLGEGDEPTIRILTKKPLIPTDAESTENPPSRSAKLRIVEKI